MNEDNIIIFRKSSLLKGDGTPFLNINFKNNTFIFNQSAVEEFKLTTGQKISVEFDTEKHKAAFVLDNNAYGFKLTKASSYRLRFRSQLLVGAFKEYVKLNCKEDSLTVKLEGNTSKTIAIHIK